RCSPQHAAHRAHPHGARSRRDRRGALDQLWGDAARELRCAHRGGGRDFAIRLMLAPPTHHEPRVQRLNLRAAWAAFPQHLASVLTGGWRLRAPRDHAAAERAGVMRRRGARPQLGRTVQAAASLIATSPRPSMMPLSSRLPVSQFMPIKLPVMMTWPAVSDLPRAAIAGGSSWSAARGSTLLPST